MGRFARKIKRRNVISKKSKKYRKRMAMVQAALFNALQKQQIENAETEEASMDTPTEE